MWETAFNNVTQSTNEVWHLFVDWAAAHLLEIVIIIVGAEIVYRVSTKTINRLVHKLTHRPDLFPTESDRKKRIKTLDSLINTFLRVLISAIALLMVVNELGINTGPLLASAGIIGVALGFGAQSLIKDFMSGFFIITENQYRVGDVIEIATLVGSIKVSGTVEGITIRTTILRDQDGRVHHIPNGNIMVTTNMTMNYAGLNEELLVHQETDLDKLEHVINHIGEEIAGEPKLHRKVLEAPYFARVDKITSEGVVVKIFGKTTPGDQWLVKGEFYKKLNKALEKNNIEMPYQQLVLKQPTKR